MQAKLDVRDTAEMDSAKMLAFREAVPFIDSMTVDSLRKVLFQRFEIKVPTVKTGKRIDPFDPYNQENFLRRGMGKFWFFMVTLIILGLIMYFRNAFPNQLVIRIRSLFNSYYFRELTTDSGISFASGSIVAGVISTLILAQAILVIVVYSGYVNLNTLIFYLLLVVIVVLWRMVLFAIQRLQAYILDITEVSRNQTQRQINVDFSISLLLFPAISLAYFNSASLVNLDVALAMAITIVIWFSLRVFLEFLGLFRESGFSFSGILYFCGFEILPHIVLLTALFRIYNA